MSSPAFRLLFESKHRDGSTSTSVLAETDNRGHADNLRSHVEAITGRTEGRRKCKRVKVAKVEKERFSVFDAKLAPPAVGKVFDSIAALSVAIGAHPTSLRLALSRAWKSKKQRSATVRGITFSYHA